MIPVRRLPQPDWFDQSVRQKGLSFLEKTPQPTENQWNTHAYWREALPGFREEYNRICNFASTWIPPATGSDSIDHFIPKTEEPTTAYDWTNFRYASLRFNRAKGKKQILDPFGIDFGWFCIDFDTLFIYANDSETLNQATKTAIENTIKALRLNEDDDLVFERIAYFMAYQSGQVSFDYLQTKTPFIAYEIIRQGLNMG